MKKPILQILILFMSIGLVGCEQDSLIDDANDSSTGAPTEGLENGIIFADDAPSFLLKPNDEALLFSINERLLDRKSEIPLSDAQIDSLNFELRGANAELFTLEKTNVEQGNPDGLAPGEHWLLFFNKDYAYFYDEVQTACVFGRCNVTLVARTSLGNEAVSLIDVQLLPQDSFGLVNGNNIEGSNGAGYRINADAAVLENTQNTLYLLPHHMVQGKRLPSRADVGSDLQYDTNGDGRVDSDEQFAALDQLEEEFWQSAILSSKQLRQAKYIILDNNGQIDERFSLGFEPAKPWFNAYDEVISAGEGDSPFSSIFSERSFFYQRYDVIKAAQEDGAWPVIYFNAPAIADEDREELVCTYESGGSTVSTPYYFDKNETLLSMIAIPTDETAPWVYFNIKLRIMGSESNDYRYFSNGLVCGAPQIFAKPSFELLVPDSTGDSKN